MAWTVVVASAEKGAPMTVAPVSGPPIDCGGGFTCANAVATSVVANARTREMRLTRRRYFITVPGQSGSFWFLVMHVATGTSEHWPGRTWSPGGKRSHRGRRLCSVSSRDELVLSPQRA